jgi:hypothetical protein
LYVHAKTGFFSPLVNVGIIMFILWDVIPHFPAFVVGHGSSHCLFLSVSSGTKVRSGESPRGETLKGHKPFLTDNDYLRKLYTQEQLSTILTKWLSLTLHEATPLLTTTEKKYAHIRAASSSPL